MNTGDQILMAVILLAVVAMVGIAGWLLYTNSGGKRKSTCVAPLVRGACVLDTPQYGVCTVIKNDLLTPTKGRLTLRDVYGQHHYLVAHVDEVEMVNVWQVLVGPHNPRFRLVPSSPRLAKQVMELQEVREERDQARYAAVRAKQAASEATAEAKLAMANREFLAEKQIRMLADLSKASQAPVVKR